MFRRLVDLLAGDNRYEFVHFGADGASDELIRFIRVEVTPADRDSMVKTLVRENIDAVVNWSLCFETFSFTAYEAIAAGAFVVTRQDAGNVWPAVRALGEGVALRTEADLLAYFRSGELILNLSRSRPRGRLIPGSMAAGVLLAQTEAA